jgi:hypothetical protein
MDSRIKVIVNGRVDWSRSNLTRMEALRLAVRAMGVISYGKWYKIGVNTRRCLTPTEERTVVVY